MKTIVKSNKSFLKRGRPSTRARPSSQAQLSDEQFRRLLQTDLADEIRTAQENFIQANGPLLRRRTPSEAKTNAAAARAMFAKWEKEDRKDPPPFNDWEKFKALLEANRMRSAPIFAE